MSMHTSIGQHPTSFGDDGYVHPLRHTILLRSLYKWQWTGDQVGKLTGGAGGRLLPPHPWKPSTILLRVMLCFGTKFVSNPVCSEWWKKACSIKLDGRSPQLLYGYSNNITGRSRAQRGNSCWCCYLIPPPHHHCYPMLCFWQQCGFSTARQYAYHRDR
jgi:hypothetical protein